MNELFIEPNVAKKTMRVSGVIAAGEHVRVTVRNTVGMGAETRLRVMCGETLVAQFPMPANPPPEVSDGDVGMKNSWDSDANDISCVLNLNTVQAERVTRCSSAPCMFVLDDVSSEVRQLYGTATHRIERWVKSSGDDIPTDLDSFPSVIDAFRADIAAWKTQVGDSLGDYQKTLSSAWNDYRNGIDTAFKQFTMAIVHAVSEKAGSSDLILHIENKNNPHNLTASQIGAATKGELQSVEDAVASAVNRASSAMSAVSEESLRAKAAESRLSDFVSAEESRATEAEKRLADGIVDAASAYENPLAEESARAKGRELEIESGVIAEKNRASGEEILLWKAVRKKQDGLTPEQILKINMALTDASAFDRAGSAANEEARAKEAEKDLLDRIAGIKTLRKEVVQVLPAVGEEDVLYLVPSQKPGDKNVRDEYLWINNVWELVGSTAIDLSGYVRTDDAGFKKAVEHATKPGNPHNTMASDIETENDGNVNDFLERLKDGLGDVTDAYEEHKNNEDIHVTSAEKQKWDAKQDALTDAQLANIEAVPQKRDRSDIFTELVLENKSLRWLKEPTYRNGAWVGEVTDDSTFSEAVIASGLLEDFRLEFFGVESEKSYGFAIRQRILTTGDVTDDLANPTEGKAADASAVVRLLRHKLDFISWVEGGGAGSRVMNGGLLFEFFNGERESSVMIPTTSSDINTEVLAFVSQLSGITADDIEVYRRFPYAGEWDADFDYNAKYYEIGEYLLSYSGAVYRLETSGASKGTPPSEYVGNYTKKMSTGVEKLIALFGSENKHLGQTITGVAEAAIKDKAMPTEGAVEGSVSAKITALETAVNGVESLLAAI